MAVTVHGIKMAFTWHLAELKHVKICSKPMDLLPLPRLQAPHLVVVIDHLVKFWHCHIGKTNIYMGLKSLFCVYICIYICYISMSYIYVHIYIYPVCQENPSCTPSCFSNGLVLTPQCLWV